MTGKTLRVLRLPWPLLIACALVSGVVASLLGAALRLGEGGESPLSTLVAAGGRLAGMTPPSWLTDDGAAGAALLVSVLAVAVGALVTACLLSAWDRPRLVVLVRALGLSRSAVAGARLLQALGAGAAGSALGLAGALLVAPVLDGLSDRGALGSGLSVRTVLLVVVVGVLVAVLGAAPSAVREAAADPSEVVRRSGAGSRSRESALSIGSGLALVLLAAGAAALVLAWHVDLPHREEFMGAGAAALCAGLLGALPVLLPCVAWLIGWVPRALIRPAGRLAVRGTADMPRRATAAGVLIVACSMTTVAGATFLASVRASVAPAAWRQLMTGATGPTLIAVLAVLAAASFICLTTATAATVAQRLDSLALEAALGATRTTLALQTALECLLVSVSAAVVGSAAGLLLGSAVRAVSAQAVSELTIAWPTIGRVLLVAAALGILAAVWPALRSARSASAHGSSGNSPAGRERWDVE